MEYESYNFRFAEEILKSKFPDVMKEIEHVISHHIKIDPSKPKAAHDMIQEAFVSQGGWSKEEFISDTIRMRHDLFKNRIAGEIETSHIIHTYKDYLKFLTSFNEGKADLGILIVYSDDFVRKHYPRKPKPKISKVKKDLELFRLIIPAPIFVIGLK